MNSLVLSEICRKRISGAGGGNRTRVSCLEGKGLTITQRPLRCLTRYLTFQARSRCSRYPQADRSHDRREAVVRCKCIANMLDRRKLTFRRYPEITSYAPLIENCKLIALDPDAWLTTTLTAIAGGHIQSKSPTSCHGTTLPRFDSNTGYKQCRSYRALFVRLGRALQCSNGALSHSFGSVPRRSATQGCVA